MSIFQSGDEFYNWMHDKDNYTIVNDPLTGYYVYAVISNNRLAPSNYIVGETDPAKVPLQKGVNVFPTGKINGNRSQKLSKTSSIKSATGTYYQLMVFVKLKDGAFTKDAAFYDRIYNTGSSSINDYFKEASYGQLEIDSKIYARNGDTLLYYEDPHTTNYYRPYDAFLNPEGYKQDERGTRENALFDSAMSYIKKYIPSDARFDGNSDGVIDNINLIIAMDNGPWQGIMWPHMSINNSFSINGYKSSQYNIVLKDAFEERGGVISEPIHEMLHSFGLPDLYRSADNSQHPLGGWDIMANGMGHMLMYCKKMLGWIDDIPVISTSGSYSVKLNLFKEGSVYRINSPRKKSEYFLVEFRKRGGNFESHIPGTGLIVYRVNEDVSFINDWGNYYGPPDHLYIYRPDGNLANDGLISRSAFTDEAGRTEINDFTNPSSFLSDGYAGGLDIKNIKVHDDYVSFDVNIKNDAQITQDKDYLVGKKGYNWIDIKSTGTKITNWVNGPLKDDNAKDDGYSGTSIPLGFDFYFYGQEYNSLFAGINGLVSFTHQHLCGSNLTYCYEDVDAGKYLKGVSWPGSQKFPNSIALAYNDFSISPFDGFSGGEIYYATVDNKFILSYENVGMKGTSAGLNSSFQMVLNPSDSSITINYKNFSNDETAKSVKVGIERDAVKGVCYYDPVLLNNEPPASNTSIYFRPDPLLVNGNYKIKKVDYSWEDISSTGTEITEWENGGGINGWNMESGYTPNKIPLGFSFSYYGQQFDSIYVGILGLASFTHKHLNYTYPELDIDGRAGGPQLGVFDFPNAISIAYGLWSMYKESPYGNGRILYKTTGKKFILSFENIGASVATPHDTLNSFQMVLNGEDNTIRLNYKKIGTEPTRQVIRVGLRKDYLNNLTYVNQGIPKENLIADSTSLLFTPGKFRPVSGGVEREETDRPKDFMVFQNFPNPFNPTTTISYSIPKYSHVELKVYDLLGREVSTLVSKYQASGRYKVQFDGSLLSSGIYIYTIQAGEYSASRKLMLLK
ncbi:MAG: M6 family metalloprotease domain-containing protein [Ignavibacteria bacterium]|nr:M6 family metalloprotease domain-containing protein [Ignavibacteria bacterium]MCU7504331.1 M6 family metalloprotease domain-containing protein [Ignavibacteria bacterium]MCU7518176.1 M6 family metalloprotease domain-containing protein [Ignavibacteria bacterium]